MEENNDVGVYVLELLVQIPAASFLCGVCMQRVHQSLRLQRSKNVLLLYRGLCDRLTYWVNKSENECVKELDGVTVSQTEN